MSADAFHDHLDACAQCRQNPFGLCPVGVDLIAKAAVAPGEAFWNTRRTPREPEFKNLPPSDFGKALRASFERRFPMCTAVAALDQPCPACDAGVPVREKRSVNVMAPDGRVFIMPDYSALEMRVMAQLAEKEDKNALVCADCGCEKSLVFEKPCPQCRGRRVVYTWAVENIFGPNWRDAFK